MLERLIAAFLEAAMLSLLRDRGQCFSFSETAA